MGLVAGMVSEVLPAASRTLDGSFVNSTVKVRIGIFLMASVLWQNWGRGDHRFQLDPSIAQTIRIEFRSYQVTRILAPCARKLYIYVV